MHDTDLDLLQRVVEGDADALSALYDRLTPVLYPMVLRIAGRRAAADDIVQETWLQVWKQADRHRPERGSVRAWVVTIARSRALDAVRSRTARRGREERNPGPRHEEAPAERAARRESARVVTEALAELPEARREVLELAYWEGLTYRQIAERLGKPVGTLKSHARRALQALREWLPEVSP